MADAKPPQRVVPKVGKRTKLLVLRLRGDPADLRDSLHQLLTNAGWSLNWDSSGWTGTATKGSKTQYLFAGPLRQYQEIGIEFSATRSDETSLALQRDVSGLWGGAMGAMHVRVSFGTLAELVEGHYRTLGYFVSSTSH